MVRIVVNPRIMSGASCFEGTRIPVEIVLGYIRAGHSAEEIFSDYPSLPVGAIEAALAWVEEHGWPEENSTNFR